MKLTIKGHHLQRNSFATPLRFWHERQAGRSSHAPWMPPKSCLSSSLLFFEQSTTKIRQYFMVNKTVTSDILLSSSEISPVSLPPICGLSHSPPRQIRGNIVQIYLPPFSNHRRQSDNHNHKDTKQHTLLLQNLSILRHWECSQRAACCATLA